MGFIKSYAKRTAARLGERALDKYVIGSAAPRRSARSAQPHERIDDLRPDVPMFGKLLRAGMPALVLLGAWILFDVAKSGSPGWVIAVVLALLGFHRSVFKWWLVSRSVAYTEGVLFPTRRLFQGAFQMLGPARIAIIALVLCALFLLLAQLVGVTTLFAWVAGLCFLAFAGAAAASAIMLGNWYARDERARYDLLWAYKVERMNDLPGDYESGLPVKVARLDQSFTLQDLPALQQYAESLEYTITDYDIVGRFRTAELSPVTPMEMAIYESAARNLGKPVYDFGMRFAWVDNDEPDMERHPRRIETLTIDRAPIGGLTPEKREDFLIALRDSLPKASDGWQIHDDQADRVKVLRYGKPLSLPDTVSLEASLPDIAGVSGWSRVPLGMNSAGKFVGMNLRRIPHTLIAGGTNSGKSTLLRTDMLGRLVRGHDIVVIDTVKGANDFLTLKPWTLMWGETIAEAANILAHVYEESVRRRAFLKKFKRGNWWDLTDEQCEEAGIRPLSVFYDEYENSIVNRTAPKSLGKEHPLVLAAQSHNIAVDFIRQYMPQLAKEARSVGIHLIVATQTPHSARIGDDLRGNLGGAIQLSAGKLEQHIVRLTMGEATMKAMEQFQKFGKKKLDEHGNELLDEDGNVMMLPGLGVVLQEGGAPTAMRVGYASEPRAVEILNDLSIREVAPWRFDDALELDMTRTVDEEDTRPEVKPPFERMSHLLGPGNADAEPFLDRQGSSNIGREDDDPKTDFFNLFRD